MFRGIYNLRYEAMDPDLRRGDDFLFTAINFYLSVYLYRAIKIPRLRDVLLLILGLFCHEVIYQAFAQGDLFGQIATRRMV